MPNVLFVVKDTTVCKAHVKLLSSKKYTIEVCGNYDQALNFLEKNKIDVVIGEIQIEEIEIGEFIKNVTEHNLCQLIFAITDEHTTYQSIYALNSGAQNIVHLNKSSKLLQAQIESGLRLTKKSSIFEYNDLYINNENYSVFYKRKEVKLSAKELKILSYICSKKGGVCKREDLINRYWKEKESNPRIVDVYIRNIRKKTADDLIKNVHGIGYRLNTTKDYK